MSRRPGPAGLDFDFLPLVVTGIAAGITGLVLYTRPQMVLGRGIWAISSLLIVCWPMACGICSCDGGAGASSCAGPCCCVIIPTAQPICCDW